MSKERETIIAIVAGKSFVACVDQWVEKFYPVNFNLGSTMPENEQEALRLSILRWSGASDQDIESLLETPISDDDPHRPIILSKIRYSLMSHVSKCALCLFNRHCATCILAKCDTVNGNTCDVEYQRALNGDLPSMQDLLERARLKLESQNG